MKNTTRFFNSLLLAGALSLGFVQASAQIDCKPVSVNLSTGIDNAGNILPVGTPDPNWQNTQGYGNVASPNGAWASLTGSAWLGNGSTGGSGTNYTYTRTFSLPGAGTLNFQALADNNVIIYLDNNPIAQTPGMTLYGFQIANVVNYSGPVGSGGHTLQAVVYNQSGPAGFNLSGSASYNPTPVTFDISTAVGGTLPIGNTDPNWSNAQGLNIVVGQYSGWDPLTGADWLGSHSGNSPVGTYTFTRTFTTFGPGSITFDALADNNVVIELDGVPVAQTPGMSVYGFQLANMASYSGSLNAGTHTLDAHVYNQGGPIGFDLHGSVSYCGEPVSVKCDVDPDFTVTGSPIWVANFSSSTNPVNTPGPNSNITHHWNFGDGNTSSAVNPSHGYAASGTYTVTHTVYRQILNDHGEIIDECKETRVCKLTISGGKFTVVSLDCGDGPIDDPIEQARKAAVPTTVSLYPNPARTELTILSNGTAFDLSIFSLDGREVLQRGQLSGTQVTIDIAGLPAGSYLARIQGRDGTSNLRFIKVQ